MKNILPKNSSDHEIDFALLFANLWSRKKFIIYFTSFFSLISMIYSLTLSNIYTATTTLNPTSTNTSRSLPDQYGGLAAIAGVNLSSSDGEMQLAIAFIKSKRMVAELMRNQSFLPDLLAAKKWDKKTNSLIYDNEVYDSKNKKWKSTDPSIQQAYDKFTSLIKITQDPKSSLITLSVDHISPKTAQGWSLWIVKTANELVANMRINESQDSINYLNNKVLETPYADLKIMFYELIQKKTQTMMLAKVNSEYALTTIDPPLIPERKSKPNRMVICILGFIFGCMLSITIVLLTPMKFKNI